MSPTTFAIRKAALTARCAQLMADYETAFLFADQMVATSMAFSPTLSCPGIATITSTCINLGGATTKKVYVEFNNKGNVLALFSDGEARPDVQKIKPEPCDYDSLIANARIYLAG